MGHSHKVPPAGRIRRRGRAAPRRTRRSIALTTGITFVAVAGTAAAVSAYREPLAAPSRPVPALTIRHPTASHTFPMPGSTGPNPSPSSSARATRPTPPAESSPTPIPAKGPGTFTTAQAVGRRVGTGATVRRYRVEVEDGIALSAQQAAREISGILASSRGWTADGIDSFQLTSAGPYDFAVKIATPGTVDAICGAAGLDTGGEVNCDVGEDVVVNLKRWVLGSPQFDGPLHDYHALIINHEVGHRIGHGHETCPGPGRSAPVMMQQIKGLKGCIANAWPYNDEGGYISGPAVP